MGVHAAGEYGAPAGWPASSRRRDHLTAAHRVTGETHRRCVKVRFTSMDITGLANRKGRLSTQSGGSRRGTRDAENHRLMHELAIDVRPSCFAASPCINWCIYLRPAKPRSQGFCSIELSVPLLPDPRLCRWVGLAPQAARLPRFRGTRTERGTVAGRTVGTRHLPRSDVGLWHVRDVTPAATRDAALNRCS